MLEELIASQSAQDIASREPSYSQGAIFGNLTRSLSMESLLVDYCRSQGISFHVEGEDQPTATILSGDVFLPIIAWQAEVRSYEILQAAAIKSGRNLRLPSFPLGSVFQRDDQAALEVFCTPPGLTNNGWGSLRITMYLYAMQSVFGITNRGRQRVDCLPFFVKYGPGSDSLLSKVVFQTPGGVDPGKNVSGSESSIH